MIRCPKGCIYLAVDDDFGRSLMAAHALKCKGPDPTQAVPLTTAECAVLARMVRQALRKNERQAAKEGFIPEPGHLDAAEVKRILFGDLLDKLIAHGPRDFDPSDGGRDAREKGTP